VVFSINILITTWMNSRFVSTAVDQTRADCSFTGWLNKPLPLAQHRTVPLFMASWSDVRQRDTHLTQNNQRFAPLFLRKITAAHRFPNSLSSSDFEMRTARDKAEI
jgi:hypothetical protein